MTSSCGNEVYREFFSEPNTTACELGAPLAVSAAVSSSAGVLNEANVNSLVLGALEQFKDQAALEEFEDQVTDWVLFFCIGGI